MRLQRLLKLSIIIVSAVYNCAQAQDAPGSFHWINFHSTTDQNTVFWVTRSLEAEHWTSIREIGVEYDAALVVTELRPTPQSLPSDDIFTIWSLSLTTHGITPLITGVNLRFVDWMQLAEGTAPELAALYENCSDCAADTYFTVFHYDLSQRAWAARWMRGGQAVPVWTATQPAGVTWSQVYAAMTDPNGRQLMATWTHFDYGAQKPPEDFLYRYDLDAYSGLEHTQPLVGKDADAMKIRLCSAQGALSGLSRGQDSPLCQPLIKPHYERKPVTTPPANNRGRSVPPGARH